MSRKVVRLTLDHLPALDLHPRTCLRWQLDAVSRSRVEPGQESAEVEAWLSEVLREWGSCGRAVLVDDQPVGVAIYAPPMFLPGIAELPTAPPSPDAIVLTQLYVAPAARGGGLARMLVQGMARDLVPRGFGAVEAFGDTRGLREGEELGRDCLLPADFLGAVGFKTHRPHVTTPRMRMDLRTARTWRSEVEQALERLVGAVRLKPQPQTEPQARAGGYVRRSEP